jgi:hypothetical protein
MCRASDVALIESGTAGYLGQTSVHIKVPFQFIHGRIKHAAMIVNRNLLQRLIPYVPFAQPQVNPFTALYGQKRTYFRMISQYVY